MLQLLNRLNFNPIFYVKLTYLHSAPVEHRYARRGVRAVNTAHHGTGTARAANEVHCSTFNAKQWHADKDEMQSSTFNLIKRHWILCLHVCLVCFRCNRVVVSQCQPPSWTLYRGYMSSRYCLTWRRSCASCMPCCRGCRSSRATVSRLHFSGR